VKTVGQKLLILCCALYLSGAHWVLLQVTAWTGMVIERTQTSGVVVAVETTFDGAHPCALCHAITEGNQEERKKDPEAPVVKKAPDSKFLAQEIFVLPVRSADGEIQWPDRVEHAEIRVEAPLTPPPLA
jgi:hypothetical protein